MVMLVRHEAAVVCLSLAHQHEESVIVCAQLYAGAGHVVCQAALLQQGCAEGKVGRCSGDARVVRGQFVLGIADLDGVDGAANVRAAGRGIEGAAGGVAVGGGVRLRGIGAGIVHDRGADLGENAILISRRTGRGEERERNEEHKDGAGMLHLQITKHAE